MSAKINNSYKVEEEYEELLCRDEWQQKRNIILQRDIHQCCWCGSKQNLQVHHRQYHRRSDNNKMVLPWEYKNEYLVTLCEQCHSRGHRLYQIPVFNI